jgi:hypothetical protein
MSCITCHGGVDGSLTKTAAHEGVNSKPSMDYEAACGQCHGDITSVYETSLHQNFHGYETLFETRSGLTFEDHPELEEEFNNECGKCHTTCGECHISRPRSVKGGLVRGHQFMPKPNQTEQCTACHGSRVGEEYTGSRDGYSADVHYVPNGMNCVSCHTGEEMHGDGTVYETRYQEPDMPRCELCHSSAENANIYHSMHWDNFQCNVCHSQDYKNCNECHVGGAGITGESYIDFKVGKNPIPDQRDYEYVVLRHIPITEDTFSPWGVDDLPNYSALPSWKYASPHNIKRWTARTDTTGGLSCGTSCHLSETGFLRAADLEDMSDAERAANLPYIVPDGPPTSWDE